MMIEQKENNVIILVAAKPNSGKFAVEFKGDKITICLENRAQNNKANIELVKQLQSILKKEVSLISGGKSRTKKLIIHNATAKDVEGALQALERD